MCACVSGVLLWMTAQARRTGTASVLGELFDHGCDSVTTIFVSLGIAIALKV